ncbi:MAG TPA: alpha/beta fold hydrolase [Candidatus Baltobacteraceae bacterium]|nr:alpha/beta fold hydrolase [Candidatus Baltobacteraceae bacterium]
MFVRCIAGLALCAAFFMPFGARAASPGLGLHLKPCTIGKVKAPAECGTFGVYENRAKRAGKTIALKVIVLKAKHPSHKAIALIAGGPGQGATEFAEPIADKLFFHDVSALNRTYDIIFMDDRGMGSSNLLQCDFSPQSDPAAYFKQVIPHKQLAACRKHLGAANDLSQYNTNATVDDLDDLRAALGYPKIVLDGGSYGTFFSLVYARRHSRHVASMVLEGVSAPGFQPLPGEPMGAEGAIEDLFTKCERDAACNTRFPDFPEHFDALIQRLNKGPIPVRLERKGKPTVTVALSKEVFVDRLREVLYDPEGASYVPYVVEQAYSGDTAPLAHLIDLISVNLDSDLAMGAWLSFTCADWVPFLDESAVRSAAAHSFTGDLRIRAQQHACSLWSVPAMPASFNQPVVSDLPILMIDGSDDPATPDKYAQAALPYLHNAKLVIVKGAGHVTETPCTDKLVVQFVHAGWAKGLKANRCTSAFSMPPFATSLKGLP